MERTADRRGCTTFASVLSTAPSTLLSRNCRAISRNPSRPSIGARNSTFAIPTGFWGRFLGWIIVGSVRHHGVPAVLEQKTTICCKYLYLLASIQRLRPESSGESIHVTGVDENHF